jgi:hypothetical protein
MWHFSDMQEFCSEFPNTTGCVGSDSRDGELNAAARGAVPIDSSR